MFKTLIFGITADLFIPSAQRCGTVFFIEADLAVVNIGKFKFIPYNVIVLFKTA